GVAGRGGVDVGLGVVGGAAVCSAVVGRGWVLRWWAGVAGCGVGKAVGVGVVGGTVVGSAVVGRALEVAAVEALVGVGHGRVTTAERVAGEGAGWGERGVGWGAGAAGWGGGEDEGVGVVGGTVTGAVVVGGGRGWCGWWGGCGFRCRRARVGCEVVGRGWWVWGWKGRRGRCRRWDGCGFRCRGASLGSSRRQNPGRGGPWTGDHRSAGHHRGT